MCVIIIKQKKQMMPREVAKTSARINPHGLGVMWLDTFEVTYHKSSEYNIIVTDRPFIAHFRYATIGKICQENTHPFVCGNNKDELLMMNGTINGYGNEKMTDSEDLAISLGDAPRHTWKKMLAKFDCRFVSINTRTRSFQIYNRDLYTYRDGIWYSKANVLQDHLVAVYGTLKKGYGNYHRYLQSAKYIGRGETKDQYPLVVSGLPYLLEKKNQGANVTIDLFKVSDAQLIKLDSLEGHPNWYIRKKIPVVVNGRTYFAWVYFNPQAESHFDGENFVKSYETTFPQTKTYADIKPISIRENICTQIDLWDDCEEDDMFNEDFIPIENETPICIDCYHDLKHDGFTNYHCGGCDGWFGEDEVLRFNSH